MVTKEPEKLIFVFSAEFGLEHEVTKLVKMGIGYTFEVPVENTNKCMRFHSDDCCIDYAEDRIIINYESEVCPPWVKPC